MNLIIIILLLFNLAWTSYLTYLFVRNKTGSHETKQTIPQVSDYGRIHLVRFNPFEELGGDQSFILVLLDSHLNGVIITSLHAKETTRLYAKPIRNGQANNVVLSKEEKIALAKAIKN